MPIHVFKGASLGWDRPYVFGAQPDHRSVVVNCKPPHAGQELPGRVSVIGNSIFEEGNKAEWFFDEFRASGTKTFSPKTRRAAEYWFHKSVSDLPTSRMS